MALSGRIQIRTSAWALLFFAAMLFVLPLQWVIAMVVAAAVHEGFHAITILLTGGKICSISIGGRGVVLHTGPMTGMQEFLCAIAGPIGSFLLVLCARWLPRAAICGFVHGAFNLIPLFPLDGGRMLRGLLDCFLGANVAGRAFGWVQKGIVFIIILGCIILTFRVGILPLLLGILLLRRQVRENPLAKKPFWRYNKGNIDKGVPL